jgi:tetratricopeptide (TPR) repeat protein
MGMDLDNGFNMNLKAIKSILLKIYDNKPDFPIESKDILIEALGGKEQTYFVNDTLGELSASTLAERSFENRENIEEPNQIIDAIIGDSFINIVAKSKCLEKIQKLEFPIESKDTFTKKAKDLLVYGVPVDSIAEKLDYPINKPEQILNRIKIMDQKLVEANIELIPDISLEKETGEEKQTKAGVKEEAKELSPKEKIKKVIELGKNAYREKEYKRAIEIYNEGLVLDHDNTELRFLKKQVEAKIVDMAIVKDDEVVADKIKTEPESKLEIKSESAPEDIPTESSEDGPTAVSSDDSTQSSSAPGGETIEPLAADSITSDGGSEQTFTAELDGSESKIEQLEKKLQEKVQALRNLATPTKDLPEDACKSCEGLGECYWCKGNGLCIKCSGTGKTSDGAECAECKGTTKCHSCQGGGKCHWCQGTGKKKE